jgi:type II secretory pathway pseudopilin PulG
MRGNDERGIMLVEVVVAIVILAVGLAAVVGAFPYSLGWAEGGKQETTAIFLAEQRIEEMKSRPFAQITAVNFPGEAYGAIPSAPAYRRTATITDSPGGFPQSKLIVVTVFYRPISGIGVLAQESQVTLRTLVANQ